MITHWVSAETFYHHQCKTSPGLSRALSEDRSHVICWSDLFFFFFFFIETLLLSEGSEIIWQEVGNNQQINKEFVDEWPQMCGACVQCEQVYRCVLMLEPWSQVSFTTIKLLSTVKLNTGRITCRRTRETQQLVHIVHFYHYTWVTDQIYNTNKPRKVVWKY